MGISQTTMNRPRIPHILASLAIGAALVAVMLLASSPQANADRGASSDDSGLRRTHGSPEGAPPTTGPDGQSRDLALPAGALAPYLYLIEANDRRRAGDIDGARAAIAKAEAANPELIEPLLARASLELLRTPGLAIQRLARAARLTGQRFTLQANLLAGLGWGSIAFILIALTLLAIIYASRVVGPLHHLLAEQLQDTIHHRLRGLAAALIICLPLLWGAGPLTTALIILILAVPRGRRGEFLIIGAGSALVIFLAVVPLTRPTLLLAPDLDHRAHILDTVQHAELTPALASELDEMAEEGIDIALLVHANALAANGNHKDAEPLLAHFITTHPDDPRGFLGLGNCRLQAGEPGEALNLYRQAVALDTTLAAPLVNMGLAFSALMQFERANLALAAAGRIDRAAVARVTAGSATDAGSSPLSLGATDDELWALFRSEQLPRPLTLPAYVRLWLPWQGGSAWALGVGLLVGACFLRRLVAKRLAPFPCSVCGSTVCRRCVTRRRGIALCRQCQAEVGEIPAHEVVRLLAAAERRRRHRRWWLRHLVWNLIVPGYGLVAAGRHLKLVLLIGFVAAAAVGFLSGGHPVVPLPAVPIGVSGLFGYWGFGILLLIALGATVGSGLAARPHLGKESSGRIVPLAAGKMPANVARGGSRAGRGAEAELGTGTDGPGSERRSAWR